MFAAATASSSSASASEWTMHTAPDGRLYYFNMKTSKSTWEKPYELKTIEEKRNDCPWKEYKTDTGKKYYYNKNTKETSWAIPEQFKELFEQQAIPIKAENDSNSELVSLANITTQEQAEEAFMQLLRQKNIPSSKTWEDAIREIITEPLYRALRTASERRAVFQKYLEEKKMKEAEERQVNFLQNKERFLELMRTKPEIKSYSRWKTVSAFLSSTLEFKAFNTDKQREDIFFIYCRELKDKESDEEQIRRNELVDRFAKILKQASDIKYLTRWSDAYPIFESHPLFLREPSLKNNLHPLDQLICFEEHIKSLERLNILNKQTERDAERHQERRNRAAFKDLLQTLVKEGKIKPFSKWKDIFPLIKDKPTYWNLLGQPGSTPLDFFWDILEELQLPVQKDIDGIVGPHVLESNWKITDENAKHTFETLIAPYASNLSSSIENCYSYYVAQEEEKRRKAMDPRNIERVLRNLKTFLKSSLVLESRWLDVEQAIEKADPEFNLIAPEEKQLLFEKRIRRLKEKADREEGEIDVSRDDERSSKRRRSYSREDEEPAHRNDYSWHARHEPRASRPYRDLDAVGIYEPLPPGGRISRGEGRRLINYGTDSPDYG